MRNARNLWMAALIFYERIPVDFTNVAGRIIVRTRAVL
jgi:hypothetical protein